MSIATDIGRIATAKQEIKEVVNQDFNKITNETIDQYANKLQETYDEYESYIPWEHGEGSEFTFKKGGTGSYLKELKINGNIEQNSYTGKNLLNPYEYNTPTEKNGITCTYDATDQSYTFNGTCTANNTTFSTKKQGVEGIEFINGITTVSAYLISGNALNYCVFRTYDANYVRNTPLDLTRLSNSEPITYATLNGTNYIATSITIRFEEGTIANNLKVKFMIADSTDTTYEPYVGGTPSPNPDYPQDIRVVENKQVVNVHGENLLDLSQCVNGYIRNDGTQGGGDTNLLSDYIKVNSGSNYMISLNTQIRNIGYAYFDENKTYISSGDNNNTSVITKAIPNNVSYIRVWFNLDNSTALTPTNILQYQPMIKQGSTATTYEPYQSQDFEIDLHGKNLFDGNNLQGHFFYNSNTYLPNATNLDWDCSDFIKVESNTQYTVSLIKLSTSSVNCQIIEWDKDKNGIANVWGNIENKTITTNSNTAYLTIAYNNTVYTNAQLEENSTATEYEEFYDYKLCKIDTYKDSIKKSTGKNLFDKDSVILGKVWNGASNTKRAYGYIEAIQGQVYTASTQDTSSDLNIYITETAVIGTGSDHIKQTELTSTLTFTPQSATKYIVVQLTATTNDITQEMVNNALIQIEKSSTPTSYEPYGTDWYIKKNIGKVVLDGSENWGLQSINSYGIANFYIRRTELMTTISNIISNRFINQKTTISNTKTSGIFNNYEYIYIRLDSNIVSTTTALSNWLGTHNTEVYYVLSTPIYEKITNSTLTSQLEAIKELKTYENKTSIMAIGADLNPVLDWTLSSGPAFQKWLNNPTVNEEEEI